MAAPTKVQDQSEAERWLREGKTYPWMVAKYLEKYNIETTVSMWANLRRKWGIDLRVERNDELLPWTVVRKHMFKYPAHMLRLEGKLRRGEEMRPQDEQRLASWKNKMTERDLVVHYDADTEEGFFLVPRRPGVDLDLIRDPKVP